MYSTNALTTGATTTAVTGATALAFTGAHIVGLVVLAVSLLFSGATVLAFTHRRRKPRAQLSN
jgi:hypothetical protein